MNESQVRDEVFALWNALAEAVPQMRTGQLMAAIGELCVDLYGHGLWDAADAEWLEAARQFRRGLDAAFTLSVEQATGAADKLFA